MKVVYEPQELFCPGRKAEKLEAIMGCFIHTFYMDSPHYFPSRMYFNRAERRCRLIARAQVEFGSELKRLNVWT